MTTEEMKDTLETIYNQIYTDREVKDYWELYSLLEELHYFMKYELRIEDYRISEMLAAGEGEYIF